ncbi:MAG: ATP-dependent Clp protease adapter ClpS [Gammaproteobacteria bacterium]|nr:ATP-dependent Clp protease adapter ClpS [Gammaproteobacteria bacterium]
MSDKKEPGGNNGSGTGLIVERSKPKLKKPPMYKVLLHNDDYTPMEFVVKLLMKIFHMSQPRAEQVMLHVHTRGIGVCGVFPREIAETKVQLVIDYAMEYQHPLQCTMDLA